MGKKPNKAAIIALTLLEVGSIALATKGIKDFKSSIKEARQLNEQYKIVYSQKFSTADDIVSLKSFKDKYNNVPMSYTSILYSVDSVLPSDDELNIQAHEVLNREQELDKQQILNDRKNNTAIFESVGGIASTISIPAYLAYKRIEKEREQQESKDSEMEYYKI